MPDFDIDFARTSAIGHSLRARRIRPRSSPPSSPSASCSEAVLRDVGRVLGMPYGQVDRICKLVPNNPAPVTLPRRWR
jgi:DNA polymerase-3 subunit alpha